MPALIILVTLLLAIAGCHPEPAHPHGPTVSPAPPPNVSLVVPVAVRIPKLAVATSTIVALGTTPEHTLDELPSTSPSGAVGWFRDAPVPGDEGPSILLGSTRTGDQPGLFAELDRLIPGDSVEVDRSDHLTVLFRLTRVQTVRHAFPNEAVFAPTPIAEIRLIACCVEHGASGKPAGQIIAYGTMIARGRSPR